MQTSSAKPGLPDFLMHCLAWPGQHCSPISILPNKFTEDLGISQAVKQSLRATRSADEMYAPSEQAQPIF